MSILVFMQHLLGHICRFLTRLIMRRRHDGLTAVQYEAICVIAYEGRSASARAQQQAFYCRMQGSEQGFRFWLDVADEVARRMGHRAGRPMTSQDKQ